MTTTGPMGAGWTVTTTFDPKRGQPTKVVDVNGKTTQAEYDPDGRLLKVWKHSRANTLTPDVEYGYHADANNWISTKTLGPGGQQILSYHIFDARLRPRQTQTPAANGTGRTITDTTYNGLGAVAKTSTFYNSSAAASSLATFDDKDVKVQQRFVYDNLGRTTAQQQWTGNGTSSSMLYDTVYTFDGDKTVTMQPPAGGTATTTINDVRGQTVELRQHLGGTPAGAVDVTTKYTYDRLGQLTQVTDTANNIWTYTYDLRGRKVSTVDPDAGTSTTTFDDAGQAIETVDGNNKKLAYKYDLLGRKTEVRDNSLSGYLRASWTYDPAAAKGQLATTSRYDTTGTYTTTIGEYDDAYRVKKTTYSIPGFASGGGTLSYEVKNTYKVDGLLETQILPSVSGLTSETLTYTYNAAAKPLAVSNSAGQTYVAASDYSYDGLLTRQTLGNTNKRVRLNTGFDDATRRLTSTGVELETATTNTYLTQYASTFSYDHAGNVTAIAGQTHNGTTLAPDQQECFTYDHLRRMTEAWTQTSGTCTTPQRTGADPYRRQWPASGGYDKLGSRLKQIDKDSTDTSWNYTIGGVDSCGGASKPHAVTSIAATGPKAGTPTRSFCYDPAGNTTKRTTDTGTMQDLAWDEEGHLRTVTQGANTWTNIYDVDGTRMIAKAPSGDTLYLSDGTEIKKLTSGQLEATRYYSHNGKTIAVRNGTSLTWMAADHHGTQQVQIGATSLTHQRRRSLPFGETRGTQPTFIGTKGYVGGTIDDTGLTHIGAREYDPTIGRFISIDPEIDHLEPQTLHGYLYSNNNPATYSDPTGRDWLTGLKNGWARVNSAPIIGIKELAVNTYKVAEAQVTAVANGEKSVGQAYMDWQSYTTAVTVEALVSPFATVAHGIDESMAAYDAAQAGDWEGATEHGYLAAADGAYTALTVWGGGAALNRFGRCHSFDPATPVLMAAGTTKAIEDVAVGDLVLATDPLTGVSEAKPVTDLHLNQDWDLADVTVLNEDTGQTSTIHTTWTHPFWNATDQQWTDAADLQPETRLREPDGTQDLVVASVDVYVGNARMRDLTVADTHTYYVMTGNRYALVHNCVAGQPSRFAVDSNGVATDLRPGLLEGPAPKSAYDMLNMVNNRTAGIGKIPGYDGNKNYANNNGALPTDVRYREWDVNPVGSIHCLVCRQRIRGPERLVTVRGGTSGYYTPDHYGSFFYVSGR